MKIEDQLTFLRRLLGEPVNPDDARWQPLELLDALNEARRWFAEKTGSFQVREAQDTTPDPTTGEPVKFYSVKNDLIKIHALEWGGRPLTPVEPRDWRSRVGVNEDLTGDPYIYKYWLRQIQLFFVPGSVQTLRHFATAYPIELPGITGTDTDFTDQQARGGMYRAAWTLKDADERDSGKEERHAREIADEFFQQYKPKGPRYVRGENAAHPLLGFLGISGS